MYRHLINQLADLTHGKRVAYRNQEETRARLLKACKASIKRLQDKEERTPKQDKRLATLRVKAHTYQYGELTERNPIPETVAPLFWAYQQCLGRISKKMSVHPSMRNLTTYVRRDQETAESIFWDVLVSYGDTVERAIKEGQGYKHLSYKAFRPLEQTAHCIDPTKSGAWDGKTYPVATLTGKVLTHRRIDTGKYSPEPSEDMGLFELLPAPLYQVETTYQTLQTALEDKTYRNRLQDLLIKRFARAFIREEQQATSWQAIDTMEEMSTDAHEEDERYNELLASMGVTSLDTKADVLAVRDWVLDLLPETQRKALTKALTTGKPVQARERIYLDKALGKAITKAVTTADELERIAQATEARNATLEAILQALTEGVTVQQALKAVING